MRLSDEEDVNEWSHVILEDCFRCQSAGFLPLQLSWPNHPYNKAINILVCRGLIRETANDDFYYITDEGVAELLTENL